MCTHAIRAFMHNIKQNTVFSLPTCSDSFHTLRSTLPPSLRRFAANILIVSIGDNSSFSQQKNRIGPIPCKKQSLKIILLKNFVSKEDLRITEKHQNDLSEIDNIPQWSKGHAKALLFVVQVDLRICNQLLCQLRMQPMR